MTPSVLVCGFALAEFRLQHKAVAGDLALAGENAEALRDLAVAAPDLDRSRLETLAFMQNTTVRSSTICRALAPDGDGHRGGSQA